MPNISVQIAGALGTQVLIPGATTPQALCSIGAPAAIYVYADQTAGNPNIYTINAASNVVASTGFTNLGGSHPYANFSGNSMADLDGFLYNVNAGAGGFFLQKWDYTNQVQVGLLGPGFFTGPQPPTQLVDQPSGRKLIIWGDFVSGGTLRIADRKNMTYVGNISGIGTKTVSSDAGGNLWVADFGGIVRCFDANSLALKFTANVPGGATNAYSMGYYSAGNQMILFLDIGGLKSVARINCSDGSIVGYGTVPNLTRWLLCAPTESGIAPTFNDGTFPTFEFINVETITGANATVTSTSYLVSAWGIPNLSPVPNQVYAAPQMFDVGSWTCWASDSTPTVPGNLYRVYFPNAPNPCPVVIPVTLSILPPPCSVFDSQGNVASTLVQDLDLNITPATALYESIVPQADVALFETDTEGRKSIVLDFNQGDGIYARDLGTIFSWTLTSRTRLYVWQPSVIPMPEGIYGRATDWDDGGIEGAKFVQGVIIEADSFNSPKTFFLQDSDTLAMHPLNETPATFNKQSVRAFSCIPFVAHSVRVISTDGVEWRVWSARVVAQPWPELCMQWQAEKTSLDLEGWGHIREMNIPHVSTADLVLTLTFDSGPPITLNILNSAGKQAKTKVTIPPNKFKLVDFGLVSAAPFRLFEKDVEVKLKQWGSTEAYRIIKPFGGPSRTGALV